MCWLSRLFKKSPSIEAKPIVLTLPHPEELPNFTQTIENVSIDKVLTKWLTDWEVPEEHWQYWKSAITITVRTDIQYAAQTWGNGVRHLDVKPAWINSGVIAHEQAHNSYALLTEAQKIEFHDVCTSLKTTNPLIKHLYSINAYGLKNDVEGHAEVYRYIGQKMSVELKQFYPKLF